MNELFAVDRKVKAIQPGKIIILTGYANAERRFWLLWILANVVGFTIADAISGGLTQAAGQPYYGVVTSAAQASRILAVSTGAALGIFGAVIGMILLVAFAKQD